MKHLVICLLLVFGVAVNATADVWRWVDNSGITHFVDSNRPIYTWVDDYGKRHYADKPAHEDAISVQLVWHAAGSLEDIDEPAEKPGRNAPEYPDETAVQRAERQAAEAYYCKRATEILDSYLGAPQLYRTNDAGERQDLSDAEMAATIADARAKTSELCAQ